MSKELQMLEDRALSPHQEAVLFEALKKIYPAGFEEQPQAEETFEVEIHTRSYWFRKRYIPWIESFTSLKNQKILEIGAGTGTSAIPLAEQGAYVFSIDINAAGLEVARIRSRLHGLDHLTDFNLGNAEEVGETFKGKQFDMVVYFASLEHMTYSERIQTLQAAWLLLSPGGTWSSSTARIAFGISMNIRRSPIFFIGFQTMWPSTTRNIQEEKASIRSSTSPSLMQTFVSHAGAAA